MRTLGRLILMTLIIVVGFGGVILVNLSDLIALRNIVFVYTPEPTLVRLDSLVIPASVNVATMTATLSEKGYQQQMNQLMEQFVTASDEIDQKWQELVDEGQIPAEQYNPHVLGIADAVNRLNVVMQQLRRLAPPTSQEMFHAKLLNMLAVVDEMTLAMMNEIDDPGSIPENEFTDLMQRLRVASGEIQSTPTER